MPEMKKTTATARELAVASSLVPGAVSVCAKLLMVPPAPPAHVGPGTLQAHVLGSLNAAPAQGAPGRSDQPRQRGRTPTGRGRIKKHRSEVQRRGAPKHRFRRRRVAPVRLVQHE